MPRKDGRIEKGQSLKSAISARAWNRAQDAADRVLGVTPSAEAGELSAIDRAPNVVLVSNGSGVVVPLGGVLNIFGPRFDPSGGGLDGSTAAASRAREFIRRPVFSGGTPAGSDDGFRIAVALEPIPVGATGRCAVGGVFPCKVRRNNVGHDYAVSLAGDATQLQSAVCGPVRLLWIEGGTGSNKWAIGAM